jgi:MFS transporter, NHS family, xanthosine permease
MNIRHRLMVMNFLEFFVWGSWLISLGGYMFTFLPEKDPTRGALVGATYGTMGIASLFMPTIMGILADRFINAEKLLGICHLIGAGMLYWASTVTNVNDMYWVILLNSCFFMPTIALNNTVSYNILIQNGMNVQKSFPPIRVWGTVGFIAAMWTVDLLGWANNSGQFLMAAGAGVCMGLYSISMPACKPARAGKGSSWVTAFGLDAFVLFRQRKMLIFFLFAMFLGAALQITNAFGDPFLRDFGSMDKYKGLFAVEHPSLLISLSQISETLFILTIPFFLKRFGIKKVMLFSMLAWVLRFGLFGIGNPAEGLVFLILSMIVYGMAFDFFNISGSLFVEREAPSSIRASAQGLFMLMTNGIGAILGGWAAGKVVDHFTTIAGKNAIKDWPSIWFCFAGYALVLAVLFVVIFRYKHDPKEELSASHH